MSSLNATHVSTSPLEQLGRIPLSDDQTPPGEALRGGPVAVSVRGGTANLPRGVLLNCAGNAIEIARLITCFQNETDRLIIDRRVLKDSTTFPHGPRIHYKNARNSVISNWLSNNSD